MVKPVYIFSGFLDAGKTTAIKESLWDQSFNAGEKSLILVFEQGDEEYDSDFLHDDIEKVVQAKIVATIVDGEEVYKA